MGYPINLNDLQRYRLYEVLLLQESKGVPHWRRTERIYDALKISQIEELDRKARESGGEPHKYEVKQVPSVYYLDEADLEYLNRLVKDWDKEDGLPKALTNASRDWRVFLPLMDAVVNAYEARKEASKSNGEATEKVQNA